MGHLLTRLKMCTSLAPEGTRRYELANGREFRMDVTVGQMECSGEFVGATIVFGEPDAEPLPGVTAVESVGIEMNPRDRDSQRTAVGKVQRALEERKTIVKDTQNA